jgi:hypothetical protein
MMVWLVLSLAGALITAFLGVCCCWPSARLRSQLPLKLALTPGLALGLSSWTFFLWLSCCGRPAKEFFLAETLLWVGLSACLCWRLRQRTDLTLSQDGKAWDGRVYLLFFILLVGGLGAFVMLAWHFPHGGWDAWAIWNLRARFLFRAGDRWQDAFSSLLIRSHTDYPLLVPANVARCWVYQGTDSLVAPVTVAALFTFATAGLLFGSLAELRSPMQGVLAAATLLGTSTFFDLAAQQYADVPLAFYYLATLVLFQLHDRCPDAPGRWLVLAGTMAGLSAWTKNEGWAFLLVLSVARAAAVLPRSGGRRFRRELVAVLLGLAVPVAVTLIFKLTLAPSNDLIAGQNWPALRERLSDGSRYLAITTALAETFLQIGPWALIVLAAHGLLLGIAPRPARAGVSFPALVLGLMLLAYCSVYVLTPINLAWHLANSLERLLHQLWPMLLFVWFLLIATPEEALTATDSALACRAGNCG